MVPVLQKCSGRAACCRARVAFELSLSMVRPRASPFRLSGPFFLLSLQNSRQRERIPHVEGTAAAARVYALATYPLPAREHARGRRHHALLLSLSFSTRFWTRKFVPSFLGLCVCVCVCVSRKNAPTRPTHRSLEARERRARLSGRRVAEERAALACHRPPRTLRRRIHRARLAASFKIQKNLGTPLVSRWNHIPDLGKRRRERERERERERLGGTCTKHSL